MDNASYHSRKCVEVTTKSWTKSKMIEWLVYYGISFPYDALKSELYTITQRAGITTKYTVDEMAKTAGCEVVRLPVAHCTLNPIELAWAQVKGHIKSNARAFNLVEVERLAWEGFDVVTPERWADLVRHVQEKVEDHYWEADGLTEQYSIREFTFRISRNPNDPDATDTSDSETSSDSASDCDPMDADEENDLL